MRNSLTLTLIAAAAVAVIGAPSAVGAQLRVRATADAGPWRTWWSAPAAPTQWTSAHAVVRDAVRWRSTSPGVELGELSLSGPGEAWRVRVVLVRLDPARTQLVLDADVDASGTVRPWTIDATPAARAAAVALNAGQFTDAGPWGWLVHGGREIQAPGRGTLSGTVVVFADGRIGVLPADSLPALRSAVASGAVREAIQSYPMLLTDGVVPTALRTAADVTPSGVDRDHRDARLAIGTLTDGRILVALTRFDGLGGALGAVPFGLTVPEMAAVMGALGSRSALMLDGGISAQLAVSETSGARQAWTGLRRVPLGLVATTRAIQISPFRAKSAM
ncbi:MAG: phosphodiester glycosidase family protein [Gemmatimonadota bacterium]